MNIDLKHTTKKELYRMLCEEQDKRMEAEEIMRKQAEHATALNDEIIKLGAEEQRLSGEIRDLKKMTRDAQLERDRANQRELETVEMLKRIRLERDDYFKSYQWCVLHPWKNLWKNAVKQ